MKSTYARLENKHLLGHPHSLNAVQFDKVQPRKSGKKRQYFCCENSFEIFRKKSAFFAYV